nr:MAG TPA_asm: hypothetical protein [Caudoviricetes sp.]
MKFRGIVNYLFTCFGYCFTPKKHIYLLNNIYILRSGTQT